MSRWKVRVIFFSRKNIPKQALFIRNVTLGYKLYREEKTSEVEDLLKPFVQRNAQNQRKLCRGGKLTYFYGADGVSRYTYHISKSLLREPFFRTDALKIIF